MDLEACYTAKEKAAHVARNAGLVKQYNRQTTAVRVAIPQIVVQARITPPKQYERLNIDSQRIITWEVTSEYDEKWKTYITESEEVVLHIRRANTYRTIILTPINGLEDIDEQQLDTNQLHQLAASQLRSQGQTRSS